MRRRANLERCRCQEVSCALQHELATELSPGDALDGRRVRKANLTMTPARRIDEDWNVRGGSGVGKWESADPFSCP